jgi:hypothetical protein
MPDWDLVPAEPFSPTGGIATTSWVDPPGPDYGLFQAIHKMGIVDPVTKTYLTEPELTEKALLFAIRPARTLPLPGLPHKRWRAIVGVQVELNAVVAGIVAPMDAALGGKLFRAYAIESPSVVGFSSPVGQSSVIRFTPSATPVVLPPPVPGSAEVISGQPQYAGQGHYTIAVYMYEPDGGTFGTIVVHIDALPPLPP